MRVFLNVGVIAAALAIATPAQSTTLLTSAVGYTGPNFTIPVFYGNSKAQLYIPVDEGIRE